MKTYILLAEICFDWSRGEYSNEFVKDVYLGHGQFENYLLAKEAAKELLHTYCDETSGVIEYDSYVDVKPI